jgi:Pyruvate/2-oxoacid:ferredoxin oxidoreductase delta subunit
VRSIKEAKVSDKKTQSKQNAPRLYDLTTLQREANSKYSFPANKTLSIAQSLYEKHKMITYPRTDSRALPDDYRNVVVHTMGTLAEPYASFAKTAIENGYVKKAGKRIFDSKQVSDHFAIIPTDVSAKKLTDDEARIYDMIARRFVASFYPEAIFDVTTRLSVVGSNIFKTEGKVLNSAGWLDVYNKGSSDKENLPKLEDNEIATLLEAKLKEAFGEDIVSATHQHIFCDSAPMLERRWCVEAGLGFIGKNHQLIHPTLGSMVHPGEIVINQSPLTNNPSAIAPLPSAIAYSCADCRLCLDACPTGALRNEKWDARQCIAYETHHCLVCQEICPYNTLHIV